jgi:hypothetical protein
MKGTSIALSLESWGKIDSIPGWLSYSAADFSYRIMQSDFFRETHGALVEIGVFKGKYLALIAHAAHGQGRNLVGLDGFLAGPNQPLESRWVDSAKSEIEDNVRIAEATALEYLILHRANTNDLSPSLFQALINDTIAFISIDAGHEAEDVYNDMRISTGLLAANGIIAADDVFNSSVPGVAEGFCAFMHSGMGKRLAPFANCGNKVFLCRTESHGTYLDLVREILEEGVEHSEYIRKSLEHMNKNTSIGFCPRMFGWEVIPLLY